MKCPICKRPVEPPASPDPKNPYPFCSERCSLIDLGRWLDGKYQIPTSPTDDDSETGPPQISDHDSEE
jgi:endogenous inhibitor of DNA gyrase (YacG/DUF329 family)